MLPEKNAKVSKLGLAQSFWRFVVEYIKNMDPRVKEIIEQLKPYKAEKIILFGSYAYGEPGPDSDFDFLVIKDTNKPMRERNVEARLLIKALVPVDIFVLTSDEFEEYKVSNYFVKEIAEEGKIVYG